MKNRFERESLPLGRQLAFLLPLIAFLLLFLLFLNGIESVSEATAAKQQESLETALTRSITQCYAVEGFYPPSLEYLKEHYGLTYDESVFLVDYDAFASNLMPEFTVLRKKN